MPVPTQARVVGLELHFALRLLQATHTFLTCIATFIELGRTLADPAWNLVSPQLSTLHASVWLNHRAQVVWFPNSSHYEATRSSTTLFPIRVRCLEWVRLPHQSWSCSFCWFRRPHIYFFSSCVLSDTVSCQNAAGCEGGEKWVHTPRCETAVTITITIYFINPSGKLKLSFDRSHNEKHISIILNHEPHAHTHS